jgi:hypothetical protein
MLRVVVSLDLKEADAVRNDFNAFLAELHWVKMSNVDTVWSFHFAERDQTQHDVTKKYLTDKLMLAAKAFKLKKISAIAQVGNAKAFGHTITLNNGVHSGADYNPFV